MARRSGSKTSATQNRQREVAAFHTPAGLSETLERDLKAAAGWFTANPNRHERLRPYQIEANDAVEAAIARGERTMLVAMATGTGKTFTTISQIYRLIKSGVARRVLFLVDRRALAAQAVRSFATFQAEPNVKFDKLYEVYSQRFQQGDFEDGDAFDPSVMPSAYLTNPGPGQTFVYVCTIQRMGIYLYGREGAFPLFGDAEGDDDEAGRLDMPINAFDVVIADECHRGYTAQERSKWRGVLDHFDAIRIGLTATPAAHTTSYFKDTVYTYKYERAVREGHLVDYDAVKISSNVRLRGVFLKPGEQVGEINPETGSEQLDLLEEERDYDASDIERRVTSPDSNRKVVKEIVRRSLERESETGHFPKTLVFAVNDQPHTSHAEQLVELFRDQLDRGDAFVAKITGRSDRPLQLIREFRNRPQPGVAVTVDLLSTGVDSSKRRSYPPDRTPPIGSHAPAAAALLPEPPSEATFQPDAPASR